MQTDEFWALVESARGDLDERWRDDGEAVAVALITRLAPSTIETIADYQLHFDGVHEALHRWDVWAAAYLIGGDRSDDSFMEFRAGVVALGRDWYERVLLSPDRLADHPVVTRAAASHDSEALFAESMIYVGIEACNWQNADEEEEYYDFIIAGEAERERTDMGEEFDFDDETQLRRRLPRLAAMFLS